MADIFRIEEFGHFRFSSSQDDCLRFSAIPLCLSTAGSRREQLNPNNTQKITWDCLVGFGELVFDILQGCAMVNGLNFLV
ncbi:MAG: hypothetical protein GY710_16310 [Desulfobacteraceae bacterium]|nr:hypothetical protein [Desulfobacteraceae bacterium]